MSLVEHLRELRSRLFRSAAALVVTTAIAWLFYEPILNLLLEPFCGLPVENTPRNADCNGSLIVTGISSAFFLQLRVAFMVGVILASPVWLYQLWAFIAPGLHHRERKWGLSFVAFGVPLFVAGAGVCYLVLPKGIGILLEFVPERAEALIEVESYLQFVTRMVLAFGLAFELPLLIVLLNLAGVLTAVRLKAWRAWMVFGIFVFAAVATPTGDPVTMLTLALPMWGMFEASAVFARVHDRRQAEREAASPFAGLGDDETSPLDA